MRINDRHPYECRHVCDCCHPAGSGSQRVRANLYGALLYYLQIAQKPSMLPGESGKELAVVYTAASSLVIEWLIVISHFASWNLCEH